MKSPETEREYAPDLEDRLRRERFERLRNVCPEVQEDFLREHLSRLDEQYFRSFPEGELSRHLRALWRLSPDHPVEVLLDIREDGSIDCTVMAFDYPSEFSLITGILAGLGFHILSGDVFTYRRSGDIPTRPGGRKRPGFAPSQDPRKRRRIIDRFSGILETSVSFEAWAEEFRKNLREIIAFLERGDEESMTRAKHQVNEMVVKRLAHFLPKSPAVLYPIRIQMDNESGSYTRMKVVSEDTPAFLYALTNALSLLGIVIEHVRIRTIRGRIEDEIHLVDKKGRIIEDTEFLDRIKLSALLTKEFTYFLGEAPDPYTALSRFEHLVRDILRLPEQGKWVDLLKNSHTLRDLAQLLGASDFLWEDFIRLQYETLLPMLKNHVGERRFSEPVATLGQRLEKSLHPAVTLEEKRARLNEFKDQEIFLIDLDHILSPEENLRTLAARLTVLAEHIVNKAVDLVYGHLVTRFGKPRSVGGLDAHFAVLGLGKLGGSALGYASDIELLFVYSDNGRTDGRVTMENSEFFDRLVREVRHFIQAKREGIFHVDLRLRPYGTAGPLACSLENFCRYYGSGGAAHSYERLALVRMRAIGGSPTLGAQLERLRDEMIYSARSIDLQELRDLREKQFREKTEGGKRNAKFSPGGLVDLEYGVQILQVMHGAEIPQLRTTRLHEALNGLIAAGVLSMEEGMRLASAYDFLRRLINGMRMLRGSARDLFLPGPDSQEFEHLARRMGYRRAGGLDPGERLWIDFETHTASVRTFLGEHFGRASLPGPASATVADLVLSDTIPIDLRERILSEARFGNPRRAYVNLKKLAGGASCRETFAKLAVLALDILAMKPDPDMALNNWERFIHALSSAEFHYKVLLSQPMRLEILLGIFSGSQFLADTVVRNPGFLDWVLVPEILHGNRNRGEIESELRAAASACDTHGEWLNRVRRLRRREILRIGVRDMCLGASPGQVMVELSTLAQAMTQVVLERAWDDLIMEGRIAGDTVPFQQSFCIMALGKLGGDELNYSSDIDLLGLCASPVGASHRAAHQEKEVFARVMERVRSDLSMHTEEGYAYRVDLRLRPFGRSGDLVPTTMSLLDYYKRKASLWEIQAALKMRPVAGNLRLGWAFLEELKPLFLQPRSPVEIVKSIRRMRSAALKTSSQGPGATVDVKTGLGGLRDVEFLIQGLQLIHAPTHPGILGANTLIAMEALCEAGILPEEAARQLKEDYLFLRRIEHYLQIMEDRQVHVLPRDPADLGALARRILGVNANGEQFMTLLNERITRVRDAYRHHLPGLQG